MVKFIETSNHKCDRSLAEADREYQRLCQLIGGKPPYGDCQLVALMVSRAVSGSEIVQGVVEFEDGYRTEHFWVRLGNLDLDPLASDWLRTTLRRIPARVVSEDEIIADYRGCIDAFLQYIPGSFFPLRWALKSEVLQLSD